MQIEKQRSLAHWATVAALLLLPPIVVFQLRSTHKRLESAYHELIETMGYRSLPASLDQAAVLMERPRSNEGSELPIFPAYEFPASSVDAAQLGCRPEAGTPVVSYDCAAIVADIPVSRERLQVLSQRVRQAKITSILRELYGPLRPSSSSAPRVLFTHAIIQIDQREVLVIFPATHLDRSYRFKKRPWYEGVRAHRQVEVSPLYHEFVYKLPALTISKESTSEGRPALLGIDLTVPFPAPGFGVYVLNLLVASGGALAYWRYYINSPSRFKKFLLCSTALVAVSYGILTLNIALTIYDVSKLSSISIARYLSLLPGAALLIVAGRSLRVRSQRAESTLLTVLVLSEISLGLLDVAADSSLFSSTFSCVSLCLFGYYVLESRQAFSDVDLEELSPHPHSLSGYMAAAYSIWGLAQFARVILSSETPIAWRFVSHLTFLGPYREILLDEYSSFVVLLYAKAVAIFTTILYLGSVESAKFKQESGAERRSAPQLELNAKGEVLRQQQLPPSFPSLRGAHFLDLVTDDEDRTEFSYILDKRVVLRNYLCRLGGTFDDRLFRISVDHAGEAQGSRMVRFRPVDQAPYLRVLDYSFLNQTAELITGLDSVLGNVAKKEVSADERLRNIVGFLEQHGHQLLHRAKVKIKAMVEAGEILTKKIDCGEAFAFLEGRLEGLKQSFPRLIFLSSASSMVPPIPQRLRLSPAVLSLIVDSLLSEVEYSWRLSGERAEYKLTFSASYASGVALDGDSYFTFTIRLSRCEGLLERFYAAEAERMLGMLHALEVARASSNFLLIEYLLQIFDGKIAVAQNLGGEVSVGLSVRFLYSSRRAV